MKKTIAIGALALMLMFSVNFVLAEVDIGGTHFGKTPCEQSEANRVTANFWNPIRIPEDHCDEDIPISSFTNRMKIVTWLRNHIYGA